MSEFDSSTWEELRVDGDTLGMECRPAEGPYQIAHRYGSPTNPGHVVLLDDGAVSYHKQPVNPRSTSCASTGRAVVADWREYGKPTGSEVSVYDVDGSVVYETDVDASSPFVALSNDGKYLAIAPYNGTTRVVNIETDELVTLHTNLLDERQKPLFVGVEPELHLGRNSGDEPAYGITLDNTVIWKSDEFAKHSFVEALSLEAGIDWDESCRRLAEEYQDGDRDVKRRVTETVAESSLATIDNEQTLTTIRRGLQRLYDLVETDDHRRAVAIPLSDTHYRLARAYKRDRITDDCLQEIEMAIQYATEGLPWYDAKKQLAKAHRFRARLHKQRGDHAKAAEDINRVFELEAEYDVKLATDGDRNLQEELTS